MGFQRSINHTQQIIYEQIAKSAFQVYNANLIQSQKFTLKTKTKTKNKPTFGKTLVNNNR